MVTTATGKAECQHINTSTKHTYTVSSVYKHMCINIHKYKPKENTETHTLF